MSGEKIVLCMYRQAQKGHGAAAINQTLLPVAVEHHRAGRMVEAERIYRKIVAKRPDAATLHLLGLLLLQTGRSSEAVERLRQAIWVRGDVAAYHGDFGAALQALGRVAEAEQAFRRALVLDKRSVEAHVNLAILLQAAGKLEEARQHYERALELQPLLAEIHLNLGTLYEHLARAEQAETPFARAFHLPTDSPSELPGERYGEQAAACFCRALELKPDLAEAHYNLGNLRQGQGRLEEALDCFRTAILCRKHCAKFHHNLGQVLRELGRVEEAVAEYELALTMEPGFTHAAFSLALARLVLGDFAGGWAGYLHRWETEAAEKPMRTYPQPLWRGEDLEDGGVLVWAEQGIGDEVMFAGIIPDVLRTGTRCVLDCDARLRPLLERSFPEVAWLGAEEGGFSAHVPIGDLGPLFRRDEAAFRQTRRGYLLPDVGERERFRERYAGPGPLVGIAWGTKNRRSGRSRSIELERWEGMFAQEPVRWINLQYGKQEALRAQIAEAGAPVHIDPSVDPIADVDRFAAQLAAMDLVITIDNSTAHLAGALGVPTWVLLPFAGDWRWFKDRTDSPWYPTVRLFRQPSPGDWDAVMREVAEALTGLRNGGGA